MKATVISIAMLGSAYAAPSVFDFRDTNTGSGFDLDGQTSGNATANGVTLHATLFPDGVFNQTGTAFGINATTGNDDPDEFDPGEGFTFSFSVDVVLNSISLSNFGNTSSAAVSFNGGPTIASILSTGVTSLSSTFVSAGTLLRFESNSSDTELNSSDFSLDSLSVTAMPEPSSFTLLGGLAALGLAATRRRRFAG